MPTISPVLSFDFVEAAAGAAGADPGNATLKSLGCCDAMNWIALTVSLSSTPSVRRATLAEGLFALYHCWKQLTAAVRFTPGSTQVAQLDPVVDRIFELSRTSDPCTHVLWGSVRVAAGSPAAPSAKPRAPLPPNEIVSMNPSPRPEFVRRLPGQREFFAHCGTGPLQSTHAGCAGKRFCAHQQSPARTPSSVGPCTGTSVTKFG